VLRDITALLHQFTANPHCGHGAKYAQGASACSSLKILRDLVVGPRPLRWVSECSKSNIGLERRDGNGRGNSMFRALAVGRGQDHDLSKKPPCLCRTDRKGLFAARGSCQNQSNGNISKGVLKCHLEHCDKNPVMRTTT
jgi:hypothetical protein